MLKNLQSFVSNGQAVGAVTALVVAIFGVLVVTGSIKEAPDTNFVSSVVVLAFTAAGLVLTYVQHAQTVQKADTVAGLTHVALGLGLSLPQLVAKLNEPAASPVASATASNTTSTSTSGGATK